MTLRLSNQEQAVHTLFLAKPTRSLVDLRSIYAGQDPPARPDHSLTAILRSLNRKLGANKKGRIERISSRGRGHVGVYKLKRR